MLLVHFYLVLSEVRNSEASWTDTKRNLRKDYRWELADLLEVAEKEKMFREHVEHLSEKKRLQFRRLLEETHQVRVCTCVCVSSCRLLPRRACGEAAGTDLVCLCACLWFQWHLE